MPVTQDRLIRLRGFGLSEYAARSYLALLDLGTAEARDISSLSKVPQAKIYHVLEQLHEKGLVVILPEFPKKYAPVAFEDYLGRLHDEHSRAADAIDREREALAHMFRVVGDVGVGDRGFFTVVRGRRNVLSKVEELVASARVDLVVLGTSGSLGPDTPFRRPFAAARGRGVRVRLLAPVEGTDPQAVERLLLSAEVREREVGEDPRGANVAIVLVDGARAFLIHFVPDDGNPQNGKDVAVYTDQEAMVAAISALVEPHWPRAAPYGRRRAEIESGREPEFTRSFAAEEDARRALAAALKGAKAVTSIRAFEPDLVQDGTQWRALVDEHPPLVVPGPNVVMRVPGVPALGRQIVIDEREAFVMISGPAGGMYVHTNARAAIDAMAAHFEALWESAVPPRAKANASR